VLRRARAARLPGPAAAGPGEVARPHEWVIISLFSLEVLGRPQGSLLVHGASRVWGGGGSAAGGGKAGPGARRGASITSMARGAREHYLHEVPVGHTFLADDHAGVRSRSEYGSAW